MAESNGVMPLKILCGIDDHEPSERAAEMAIDLARRLDARLWFFMANPTILPGRGAPAYLYSEDYIARYLREALRRANAAGVIEVKCATCNVSDIAAAVVAYGKELTVDLVVIGSDNQAMWKRWFRPSISRRVLSLADFPVLVVKQKC